MNPLPILEKKASDLGVKIGWLSLNKYTPPSASTKYNKIAMNENWHNQEEIPFQLAHELAHIINHDDCEMAFYHASYSSQERIEREANIGAIKLLLPIFNDMGYSNNPVTFMQVFHVPNYLFDNVTKIMKLSKWKFNHNDWRK